MLGALSKSAEGAAVLHLFKAAAAAVSRLFNVTAHPLCILNAATLRFSCCASASTSASDLNTNPARFRPEKNDTNQIYCKFIGRRGETLRISNQDVSCPRIRQGQFAHCHPSHIHS
jgi:hypothetical protein